MLVVEGRCVVYIVWVGWRLHLRCGFQCCLCWTDLFCWSYGLKCKQCEGMAWNCWCWRYLDFYRKRLNPTSQSWTQIWIDSREGNAGKWETLWACRVQVYYLRACRAQVWILIHHGGWSMQSTGIKIDWCWHLPLIFRTVGGSNWVIDLFIDTWLIR